MTNLLKYLWPILIAIYIISPFDAHPLFLDDIIASAVLFYILYKNARQKKQQQQYHDHFRQSHQKETGAEGPLTLDEACRLLGVSPNDPPDEINRAYKEKMTKSHPDKVSHLSEELQEKAEELTLRLNEAYDLIKKRRSP